MFTVALTGCYSTLIYGDGKTFKTKFYNAQLLGELPVPGKAPVLVFSGRPKRPCWTRFECDSKTFVYFQSTSDKPNDWSENPLRIPGDYFSTESGKRVAQVRMFIGHCVGDKDGVVWFIAAQDDRPKQTRFVSESQVILEYFYGDKWTAKFGGGWQVHFPPDTPISIAETAVSNRECREVSPRQSIYRTSEQYSELDWPPDVNLRLTGSEPPLRVKQWIKYFVTLDLTQGTVLIFAPEKFATSAFSSETLIVLTQPEYDGLTTLARSQPCLDPLPPNFGGRAHVVEHDHDDNTECILDAQSACAFLKAASELQNVQWTQDHLKTLRNVSQGTACKDFESLGHRADPSADLQPMGVKIESHHPILEQSHPNGPIE